MINADRYRHTGRTYVNIFRAHRIGRFSFLGLTPQAMKVPLISTLTQLSVVAK